jgi:DNA repair protein RadC
MNPTTNETPETEPKRRVYPMAGTARIKDLPRNLQPREVMEASGAAQVEDDVLLAVLLRAGLPGRNVRDLARELLKTTGGLRELAQASVQEISKIKGIGRVKALTLIAAAEMGRRIRDEGLEDSPALRSPDEVERFMRKHADVEMEKFWVLPLNKKNRLIPRNPLVVSTGLVDASLVHAREVYIHVIRALASAAIVVHNHPSGDPEPSAEDIRITRALVDSGRVLGMPLLDHVILGNPGHPRHPQGYYSIREAGLVQFDAA